MFFLGLLTRMRSLRYRSKIRLTRREPPALVIPRPRFATKTGEFLAITLRDGAVNRYCGLGRRAKGTTLGCAFLVALAVHDRRRSDHIRVNRP
jgi:hypothetical protein